MSTVGILEDIDHQYLTVFNGFQGMGEGSWQKKIHITVSYVPVQRDGSEFIYREQNN